MADNTYTTKNYSEHGGDKLVIGGALEILPGAAVTGLPGAFTPVENQPVSTATTIAALKEDFNALLAKLKAAGIMAADEVTGE
jgi:hypothetical protein